MYSLSTAAVVFTASITGRVLGTYGDYTQAAQQAEPRM